MLVPKCWSRRAGPEVRRNYLAVRRERSSRRALDTGTRHETMPGSWRAREAMIANRHITARIVCVAVALSAASIGGAAAQDYPTRPIHWVIGFPAGGPTDILVRLMGEWLQTRFGQPVVVENKPGAASNIATEVVVNAAPAGYTIGSAPAPNPITPPAPTPPLTLPPLQPPVPA